MTIEEMAYIKSESNLTKLQLSHTIAFVSVAGLDRFSQFPDIRHEDSEKKLSQVTRHETAIQLSHTYWPSPKRIEMLEKFSSSKSLIVPVPNMRQGSQWVLTGRRPLTISPKTNYANRSRLSTGGHLKLSVLWR